MQHRPLLPSLGGTPSPPTAAPWEEPEGCYPAPPGQGPWAVVVPTHLWGCSEVQGRAMEGGGPGGSWGGGGSRGAQPKAMWVPGHPPAVPHWALRRAEVPVTRQERAGEPGRRARLPVPNDRAPQGRRPGKAPGSTCFRASSAPGPFRFQLQQKESSSPRPQPPCPAPLAPPCPPQLRPPRLPAPCTQGPALVPMGPQRWGLIWPGMASFLNCSLLMS